MFFYEKNKEAFRIEKNKNMSFGLHLHRDIELIYLLEGEIKITVNNTEYILNKGEIAIVFPNTIHSYQSTVDNKYIMMIVSTDLLYEYREIITKQNVQHPVIKKDNIDLDVVHCLKRLTKEKKALNSKIINSYIGVIIGHIFSKLTFNRTEVPEDLSLPQRALIYMSENFKERFSLEDMARSLGISKCYLSTVFSKKLGINFNNYVNMLRINFAKNHLAYTTVPITEISYDCGFDSQRTFNRAFFKEQQCTPGEYRKNNIILQKYDTDLQS